MINQRAARLIVEREINKHPSHDKRLVVYDHMTINRDWGWIMYYGSEEGLYLETKPTDTLAYLINRVTSELQQSGKS